MYIFCSVTTLVYFCNATMNAKAVNALCSGTHRTPALTQVEVSNTDIKNHRRPSWMKKHLSTRAPIAKHMIWKKGRNKGTPQIQKTPISQSGPGCESRKRDRIPPKKLCCPDNRRKSKSKRPLVATKHFQHSYVEYKENSIFGKILMM